MDPDHFSTLGKTGNLSLGSFQPTNDSLTTNLSYFTRDRRALLLGDYTQPSPLTPQSSENSKHESLTTVDPMAVIGCAVLHKENRQVCTTCMPGKGNWCNASRSIFGSTPPAYIAVRSTHLGQETCERKPRRRRRPSRRRQRKSHNRRREMQKGKKCAGIKTQGVS